MQLDAESCTLLARLLKAMGEPFVRTPVIDQGDSEIEWLKHILTKSKGCIGMKKPNVWRMGAVDIAQAQSPLPISEYFSQLMLGVVTSCESLVEHGFWISGTS